MEKIVKRAGYPQWDKTLLSDNSKAAVRYSARSSSADASFFYTPFTADGINGVQAIMITRIEGTDRCWDC